MVNAQVDVQSKQMAWYGIQYDLIALPLFGIQAKLEINTSHHPRMIGTSTAERRYRRLIPATSHGKFRKRELKNSKAPV